MTVAVPAVLPRQARADRILDAAAELMLRMGYKRVTVEDVAERAGIGKGTIYLHWTTREELFCAVIERDLAGALDELVAEMHAEPEAALPHRLLSAHFLHVMQRPLLRALFAADLNVLGKLMNAEAALQGAWRRGFAEYVHVLAQQSMLRSGLGETDALYMMRAISRGFFVSAEMDAPIPLERQAEILESAVEHALSLGRVSASATKHVVASVLPIFEAIAELYHADLRRAYE